MHRGGKCTGESKRKMSEAKQIGKFLGMTSIVKRGRVHRTKTEPDKFF